MLTSFWLCLFIIKLYSRNDIFKHLSLFSPVYWNWHTIIGIFYSKEITTTVNITTTTATTINKKVNANSGLGPVI